MLSVAELANLPASCPIRGVSGKIDKLFPIEGRGWRYQNGFLRDPATGAEVRFQFKNWSRVIEPKDYQGGFMEVTAADETSLVWKKQKADQSIVKLEIAESATVTLLTAAEYRAKGAPVPGAGTPSRIAVPEASTLFSAPSAPASAAPKSATPGGNAAALEQVHQLGALFVLCEDEAAVLLQQERNTPAVRTTAETIFAQASACGVFTKIDVAAFWLTRDPEIAAKMGLVKPVSWTPSVAEIAALVGENPDRERRANAMLKELRIIEANQTWRDLPEDRAAEILKQGFFKLAISVAA